VGPRPRSRSVNGANAGWNLPDGSTKSPDASWTSDEQLARVTAEEQEKYLPICPDFVAEMRSKSYSITSLNEEMELWIANGAKLGWLIDPYSLTVDIARPGQQPETFKCLKCWKAKAQSPAFGWKWSGSGLSRFRKLGILALVRLWRLRSIRRWESCFAEKLKASRRSGPKLSWPEIVASEIIAGRLASSWSRLSLPPK